MSDTGRKSGSNVRPDSGDLALDRRELLVALGAVVVACAPIATSAGDAANGAVPPGASTVALRSAAPPPLDDWTIDDMWGVCPRPSEPIGYGRPHGDGELIAAIHPADAALLAA